MFRFLLVHYLAFATALLPVMCCCAPQKLFGSHAASDARQTEPVKHCCCHKSEPPASIPCNAPAKSPHKECPCGGGKLFLGALKTAEKDTADSGWAFETSLKLNLLAPCLAQPCHGAEVRVLTLTALRLDSSFLSAVDVLRAECVQRC